MNCQPPKITSVLKNFPGEFWIAVFDGNTRMNGQEKSEKIDELRGIN
jgi:hypothetical protein